MSKVASKTEKVKPQVTGEIQVNRQKVAGVALWVQDNDAGSKRPNLRGKVTLADGSVQYISLWLHGYTLSKVDE